jgi:hypothetical protein
MGSSEQHPNQSSRRDRFPTEWALDYGNERDPVEQAQQREGACLEARISGRPHLDEADWASGPPPSRQFG